MTTSPNTEFLEKHKKSVWIARATYAAIMLSFLHIVSSMRKFTVLM
jgi:hypothetical protein